MCVYNIIHINQKQFCIAFYYTLSPPISQHLIVVYYTLPFCFYPIPLLGLRPLVKVVFYAK